MVVRNTDTEPLSAHGPPGVLDAAARRTLVRVEHRARRQTGALLMIDAVLAALLSAQGSALFPACWFVVVGTGSVLHLLLLATLLAQPDETLEEKQTLAAWSFSGQAVLRLSALLLFPALPASLQLALTAYSLLLAVAGPRPSAAPLAARSLALLGTLPIAIAWLLPLSAYEGWLRCFVAALLVLTGGLLVRRRR